MNLLCTNSNFESQFGACQSIRSHYEFLYLDKSYEMQISETEMSVSQNLKTHSLRASDCVVFLLFFAPHEDAASPAEAVKLLECLQLFEDACEVIGVKQFNRLCNWNRAYLKTALLRLNKSFPGLVPTTFLIDGTNVESVRFGLVDRIMKVWLRSSPPD